MDYHVFILSRVKELVDRGVPTDEAIARGIRTTASTVTAAAAVMVAVLDRPRGPTGSRLGVIPARIPAADRRGRDQTFSRALSLETAAAVSSGG